MPPRWTRNGITEVPVKYKGVMYSSPRLDAEGVASTPEGQQYIYSKDDRAFSVADGERYFELAKCK